MIILSNQLEENRLNLSMLSMIFLLLNAEFVEVGSAEMQYEEAKIDPKIEPEINTKINPNINSKIDPYLEQISQHQEMLW